MRVYVWAIGIVVAVTVVDQVMAIRKERKFRRTGGQ